MHWSDENPDPNSPELLSRRAAVVRSRRGPSEHDRKAHLVDLARGWPNAIGLDCASGSVYVSRGLRPCPAALCHRWLRSPVDWASPTRPSAMRSSSSVLAPELPRS